MRISYLLFTIFSCIATGFSQAQSKTDSSFLAILSSSQYPVVKQVLQDYSKYRCQIIYTQINRDASNKPSFQNYYFNYDPSLYYNPASLVKMPLAFLALEKLNEMNIPGVDKYTNLVYDSSYVKQTSAYADSTSANKLPSISHYIKRAFLISENDPYNRLYQFVGQQEINDKLHSKGYPGIRITRQFMGFTEEQNRHTNAIRFIKPNGTNLYYQAAAYNKKDFDFGPEKKLGKAFLKGDSLINEPFDFTKHNNASLLDFQQILQSVLFPSSVPATQRFNLSSSDRKFLLQYLSQYPSETNYPKYNDSLFFDSYVKFFFRDNTHKMPEHVRVFNKVGWSYGFLSDISYIIDTKNKIEFMLSATIYTNSDEILNDGKYDYDTIGYPFLYQIGQTMYQYELKRNRKYKPNLNEFLIRYEKRKKSDTRPLISVVDN